jgi:hypothetical protein
VTSQNVWTAAESLSLVSVAITENHQLGHLERIQYFPFMVLEAGRSKVKGPLLMSTFLMVGTLQSPKMAEGITW